MHFLSSTYALTRDISPLDLVHLPGGLVAAHEVEVAPGRDQVQGAPVQAAQLRHQLLCETPAGETVSTGPEQASLECVITFTPRPMQVAMMASMKVASRHSSSSVSKASRITKLPQNSDPRH